MVACAQVAETPTHPALANERISRSLSLVGCETTYLWSDQAYAYASMLGTTCITDVDAFRVRVYESGPAAALGLSDEVAVMAQGSQVLAGDAWFAVVPTRLAAQFTREFPELQELTDDMVQRLQQNPVPGDRRDMCVVAVASIINAHADGLTEEADEIVSGHQEVFPTAVEAADEVGRQLAHGDRETLKVFREKDDDPFTHDSLLAEIVSPLKADCDRDTEGQ